MATRIARLSSDLSEQVAFDGCQEMYTSVKACRNRTANRHRWEGRVDQGVREKHGLGTRQNSGRNFGIRPAPSGGRSKRCHATVYQKHSSLLNRKMMYRGRCLASVRTLRKRVIEIYFKKLATEALMNAGGNNNRPKVAKFLVG